MPKARPRPSALTYIIPKIFHSGHNDPTSWHGYYPALDHERPDEATPRGNLPVNNNYFGGTTFDWGPIVAEDAATTDGQIADWMARHLHEPSDAPRFDAIGFRRPHQPWYVPEKYFDMHPLEQIKLPPIIENDLEDVPDAAQEAGAVYLFTREGETWAQEAYVKGSNTETFDEFGSSVSISTAVLPIRRFISLRTRILPSSSKASSRRCSGARPTFAIGWRTLTERVGNWK